MFGEGVESGVDDDEEEESLSIIDIVQSSKGIAPCGLPLFYNVKYA